MDSSTYTPRHRDETAAQILDAVPGGGDLASLAGDPPPQHPSGIVAGKRRRLRGRIADIHALRMLDQQSETGSTTLGVALAFWTVTGLLGVVAGFLHLAQQAAGS